MSEKETKPAFKLDFNQKLLNVRGKEMLVTDDEGGNKPLLMKDACVNALQALTENQGRTMDGTAKMERYLLAERIHKAEGPIELKVDEIKLLKTQVGIICTVEAVGFIYGKLPD